VSTEEQTKTKRGLDEEMKREESGDTGVKQSCDEFTD